MLVAYLDDTGTHRDSAVVGLLGMVGTTYEWSRIERPWKRNLEVTGVSCFHASHCEMGRGEFEGKDRSLRDLLVNALSTLIAENNLFVVGSAVLRRDYEEIVTAKLKARFVDPFYLCFEHCMQQIHLWSKQSAGGERVALVFSEQQEYENRVSWLHRAYQNSKFYDVGLGSLSIAKPKCVIQLQVADLVAYEGYKYLLAKMNTPEPAIRPALKNLLGSIPMIARAHDRKSLAKIIAAGPYGLL